MWIADEAGDLVNLSKMECIAITAVEYPDAEATHQVVAIPPGDENGGYSLASGDLEKCKTVRGSIVMMLQQANQWL